MIALLLALLITGYEPQPLRYPASFITCYDGDTCTFDFNMGLHIELRDQVLRLCDIDAPEMRSLDREIAINSRDELIRMIATSTVVEVQVYGRDSFGRWLGYVYGDDVDLNKRMVEQRRARPYRIKCR